MTNNLKLVRLDRGLSQRDLSEISGVKFGMIQKYEQGSKNIDHAKLETLVNLASALNCDITDILNSDELRKKFREVQT